jgi:hypothetical protein
MSTDAWHVDRRSAALGAAAVMLMPCVPVAALNRTKPPLDVKAWLHQPTAPAFAVPHDYLGIHSDHGLDGRTPAPTYPYGAVRSHDANGANQSSLTQWAGIERAPGQYDWRAVDRWIASHPGRSRIWVLFGCPAFYQKYPGEKFPYPDVPGGGSPPKDPRVAADFIAALLRRYPGAFKFIELWNEPNFGWSGSDPTRDRWRMEKPGFFTGTASDLAAMARAVRGVLTTDVKLLAGAWEGQDASTSQTNSMLRFSAAPDGKGGIGRQHVQALSVHAYTYNNDPNTLITVLRNYIARFKQAGYPDSMERYVSEIGAEAPVFWTRTTPPIEDKVRAVKRWLMIPAALGYRGVYLYKHSLERTLGDPARTPELSAAIRDVHASLVGRTLVQAALLSDDTVWLGFDDSTSLRA